MFIPFVLFVVSSYILASPDLGKPSLGLAVNGADIRLTKAQL